MEFWNYAFFKVIEIWTRRHFRCDCGNSKFGVGICKLFSSKDTENSENVYNQNFTGVYCTCKRPYPDPDCTEDVGEMLQCCVCEDWFHEIHLGLASADEVHRTCNALAFIYFYFGGERSCQYSYLHCMKFPKITIIFSKSLKKSDKNH